MSYLIEMGNRVSERKMSDRSGGGGAFNFPSAVHEANTAYACWAVARSVGGGQGWGRFLGCVLAVRILDRMQDIRSPRFPSFAENEWSMVGQVDKSCLYRELTSMDKRQT